MTKRRVTHVPTDTARRLAITRELELAVSTLESGFGALERGRKHAVKHALFLTLLSSGVERLLKTLLQLDALAGTGALFTRDSLNKSPLRDAWVRHRLTRLQAEVLRAGYSPAALRRPLASEDHDFLTTDAIFGRLLTLLADFAENYRSAYLDVGAELGEMPEWPDDRWRELELFTMAEGRYARLVLDEKFDAVKRHADRTLIASLERFVRALARLVIAGDFGAEGLAAAAPLRRYWALSDDELGKTRYEQ